jgi:hypothetical protein
LQALKQASMQIFIYLSRLRYFESGLSSIETAQIIQILLRSMHQKLNHRPTHTGREVAYPVGLKGPLSVLKPIVCPQCDTERIGYFGLRQTGSFTSLPKGGSNCVQSRHFSSKFPSGHVAYD